MGKQTVMFVVLPNGVSPEGNLHLSVFMSPRLEGNTTLAGFPDFLHWAGLVKNHGLKFKLASGAQTATVSVDQSVLRPDIWGDIFTPQITVEAYRLPDLEKRLLVSYPTRDAMAFVKFAYQTVASQIMRPTEGERGILRQLLAPLVFRNGRQTQLYNILPEFRVELWKRQQARATVGGARRATNAIADTATLPPDGIPTTLSAPPNTRDMITRFELFHHMKPSNHRPPLPKTEADFKKTFDFHKALTAIGSYPALMRRLGLVFDLEVPAGFLGDSPAVVGGPYLNVAVAGVSPGFAWNIAPQFVLPETAYYRAGNEFTAAPVTPSTGLPGHNYDAGDVIGGMLVLDPQYFHLTQVDVDGALLKTLSLADNVALVAFENTRNPTHPVNVEQILPALRSGGIALMADGRAEQLLASIRSNREFDNALQANAPLPRPFLTRDLVRGYRLDIWSSRTRQWYSLHRRHSTYKFGADLNRTLTVADEEGFTQLAAAAPDQDPTRAVDKVAQAAGAPQPGNDLFVHERVARWNGWSLSVQRPGGAINRSADPAKSTDPDPTVNQPVTPFKMVSNFAPVNGSLPPLRFGTEYRLRARTVDLGGNSVPLGHKSPPDVATPGGTPLPYFRFEPVADPVMMLRENLNPGASLERLVIRSYNSHPSLDKVITAENDQRHILPPRTSEHMAEQHGMFDDAQGKLKGDPATYAEIIKRDAAELPLSKPGGPPLDPHPQASAPYLPDPIARGAAFRDLPNTPDNTNGTLKSSGKLHYDPITTVQQRPGSVTYIDFGAAWPNRLPFRMVLAEGKEAPHWDQQHRVMTIHLTKGEMAQTPLSCYLTSADLKLMGVWDWMRQYCEAAEMQSRTFSGPVLPTDLIGLLTRLTLEGGHPMITPSRQLMLVHAVQQPLGIPEFSVLPVRHGAAPSTDPSALPNAFAPITAWRSLESHDAALLGGLHIHGNSTAKIDIEANWLEYVDDPSQPAPARQKASAHVEKIELPAATPGVLYSDASNQRMVATYIPEGDMLWFSAPFDSMPGITPPGDLAAPLHRFTDTKHRLVRYQAVATSRFEEYFPPKKGQTFTRSSPRITVNVPSSARPAAPEVAYVLPVFGSQRQETTNVKTDVRFGNGLRVYLQRPWYSSGERELLGVVLWPYGNPLSFDTREKYKPFFTQWGLDPLWQTSNISVAPSTYSFPEAVASAQGLTLQETDLSVDVSGHCVAFDRRRKLWYCDITFENSAYLPFVRLALARHQPHSLPGVELSHVVLADFAQLTPDRSATVTIDTADPSRARVFIGGVGPEGPRHNTIEVAVEQRMKNVISDVGWEPAPPEVVTVTPDAPGSEAPDVLLWSGTVKFTKPPKRGQYRVVVREYESLPGDSLMLLPRKAKLIKIPVSYSQRLVYAAILPYDFPAGQ
jgi:hypothetical protein